MLKKRKNAEKVIVPKAVPVPCLSRLCLKLSGEQGSGRKGVNDLCFQYMGNFLLLLLLLPLASGLLAEIWISRLRFGRQGWDLCL